MSFSHKRFNDTKTSAQVCVLKHTYFNISQRGIIRACPISRLQDEVGITRGQSTENNLSAKNPKIGLMVRILPAACKIVQTLVVSAMAAVFKLDVGPEEQ